MADDDTTPDPAEAPTDGTEPAEVAAATEPREAEDPSANREAARWRVKFRESEWAVELLTDQVNQLMRRDVERLAGARLAQPGDLWEIGQVDLANLVGPDGYVDGDLVTEALEALLAMRPGLAKTEPRPFPDFGGGRRGGATSPGHAWADVLGQNRKS